MSLAANWSLTGQCNQHERGVSLVPDMIAPKVLLPPPKNVSLVQKRPNLAKNSHFWPNIGIFGLFDPMPDQKTMQTRCLGGFSVVWVPKHMLPPVRIRIFGPKKAKFGPKYAFLVHLVLCWLVVLARRL